MDSLKRIYSDIKEVKIQGATNIAKAAAKAYLIKKTKENKKKLLSLRPTEPTLSNTLNFLDKWDKEKVINHFPEAQEKINKIVFKILREGDMVYTHCHSTNVVKALVYARRKGKKFCVVNTETRPLYQGRQTARELSAAGIRVTEYVDSAMDVAIKSASVVLLGADAILKDGIINKIGSMSIAELAYIHDIPVYVVADSWKFSPRNVKIEERNFHEVWEKAPKHVKLKNPAFEKVDAKYIKAIVSEYGILKLDRFVKKAEKIIS